MKAICIHKYMKRFFFHKFHLVKFPIYLAFFFFFVKRETQWLRDRRINTQLVAYVVYRIFWLQK